MGIQTAYTSLQTMKLTGITARQLQYWDETGFISPSIFVASIRKRKPRRYSYVDLVAIRAVVKLRRMEISLQTLRKVNERMRDYKDASFANTYLVGNMVADVVIQTGDEIVSMLRNPGQVQFAWMLNISDVEQEVKAAIVEMEKAA